MLPGRKANVITREERFVRYGKGAKDGTSIIGPQGRQEAREYFENTQIIPIQAKVSYSAMSRPKGVMKKPYNHC